MTSPHLSQAELLSAVVDEADLSAERNAHLNACPACRGAREHLQERFLRLGRAARELAPAPARPFRLPETRRPGTLRRFKPVWGMGAAAAMLLAIVVVSGPWPPSSPPPVPSAAMLEADRRLGEAIDALVTNALPLAFQHLASLDEPAAETDPQIDEEWLDWVVPPIETDDDSLT